MSKITAMLNQTVEMPDYSESFVYQYPETEELDGHVFHHVHGGVYIAEKEFQVLPKDLWLLSRKYPDVEYIMRQDGIVDDRPVRTVFFARSYTHARHDVSDFRTFVERTQKWTDSREKRILDNINYFETYCHNSYGSENIEDSVYGRFSYVLPNKSNTYLGYQKHIVVDGLIGYMFLPGIYYFGYTKQDIDECGTSDEWSLQTMLRAVPRIDLNTRFREKTSMIALSEDFHPTFYANIRYLAVGEENKSVLKKIIRTIENGKSAFFWEFEMEDPARQKQDILDLQNFVEVQRKRKEKLLQQIVVEEDAEELLPEVGITDVTVGMKYIFCSRVEMKRYDYAYKLGDRLILVEMDIDGRAVRNEYDLRMLEELMVRRKVQMHCGVMMERDYPVIDCRKEKEKQILTGEAYELFAKCCNGGCYE